MRRRRRHKKRVRAALELIFPGLRGKKWRLTSDYTKRYNCIAWAVGDTHRRWDLIDGHWPNTVQRNYSLDALIDAYVTKGFEVCDENGRVFDPEFEKVVLYGTVSSGGRGRRWSHAAKLMPSGMWSSKLGNLEDIQHVAPEDVNCAAYGEPLVYMRRKR